MSEIPVDRPAGKGRPWLKWVAVGCFGLLVLGALAAGALVFGVLAVVKRSDVYEEAVSRARTEPRVTAALGEPVEPGWFVMGSVEVSGPGGEASLSIPLEGPRGEGTLYVEATKRAGAWVYETLQLAVEGSGERIDLLGEEPDEGAWPPAAPAPSSAAPEAGPRTAPRSPSLDAIVFSASEDAAGETGERFPAGAREIFARVRFASLGPNDEVVHRWYRGDEKIAEDHLDLRAAAAGDQLPPSGWLTLRLGDADGLPPGNYRVDVWLDGRRGQSGTFLIE